MFRYRTIIQLCVLFLILTMLSGGCARPPVIGPSAQGTTSDTTSGTLAKSATQPETPPTARARQTLPPATLTADIDTFLRKLVEDHRFSGVVLVARDGDILLSQGYDLANRTQKIPNTPQTRLPIASITKQFTAMGFMILQARGKLDVQDLACKYLTRCPTAWKQITIHQLLTHTAGIPDVIESPEDILAHYGDKPLVNPPGEEFNYSDGGYSLLGQIIAQASGQPYEVFLQQNVFDPLNMTHTSFKGNPDLSSGLEPIPENYAAGGLYSTAEDLYLYDQALYTEKLLPKALLDQMMMSHVKITSFFRQSYVGMGYGYGWFIGEQDHHKVIHHRGQLGGFGSTFARYPDDKVTIIVLGNNNDAADFIRSELVKMIFGNQ